MTGLVLGVGMVELAVDEFSVLHALRLRGRADRGLLVEISWLCPEHVDLALDGLAAAGLIAHRHGAPFPGWELTAEGLDAHAVAAVADAAEHLALVEQAYSRFVVHRAAFVQICADWQVLPDGSPNTHADPAHDGAVLDRLTVLAHEVTLLTDELAGAITRFGRYAPRFTAARNRAGTGEHSGLTRPHAGSYRDVWTELHEDLLVTLGRGGHRA